jgi:7-cyano-7-deazaguanine synthase in queuosine biosynthesis
MSNFVAKVGSSGGSEAAGILLLVPGENLRTGLDDFKNEYSDFTTLEEDMLTVASAIYACDLAFKRGDREEITRSISLEIPVINYHAFRSTKAELELLLWTLSHDNWTIKFSRIDGQPESKREWPKDKGVTILFSGGVDSFAGALELLIARGYGNVQLASHVTANPVTRQSQDELLSYLETRFKGGVKRIALRSGGRNKGKYLFPSDADREDTQRTRSFMYLSVAALAARRSGHNELVVIAENGQMAIHLPLSVARVGAFSTHTAHPEFVAQAASFFTRILDRELKVSNPFLYKTKSEVVASIPTVDRGALSQSVSCWRGARVPSFKHCGDCVPCLVRRIAFESNNIFLAEYKNDLFAQDVPNLDENNEGKRNLVELAEFTQAFASKSDAELEQVFPDLISTDFDRTVAIAMYRRFATEAKTVLSKYPGPAKLFAPTSKGSRSQPTKVRQA